jgi:general stress protein YciG
MAERDHIQTMAQMAANREPPTGSTGDRPDIGKPGGTVGRDVPEHSKDKDTEVAVEAGRKGAKDETGAGGRKER